MSGIANLSVAGATYGSAADLTVTQAVYGADSPIPSGSGTVEDPYQIANVQHLEVMRSTLAGNFVLVADIDLNNEPWTPIGTSQSPFTGKLVGNGHKISNLKVDLPSVQSVVFFRRHQGRND